MINSWFGLRGLACETGCGVQESNAVYQLKLKVKYTSNLQLLLLSSDNKFMSV